MRRFKFVEMNDITLMIAESDPKAKDIMTTMVMNLLSVG